MEFLIGFLTGFIVCGFMIKSAINDAVERIITEEEQGNKKFNEDTIPARLELVDGQYLLYNNNTDEFLGQGSDYKEILASIKQRFKEYSFQIVAGDKTAIAELKQQRDESK